MKKTAERFLCMVLIMALFISAMPITAYAMVHGDDEEPDAENAESPSRAFARGVRAAVRDGAACGMADRLQVRTQRGDQIARVRSRRDVAGDQRLAAQTFVDNEIGTFLGDDARDFIEAHAASRAG